ncbi:MAG TPA: peptidoglycan DD-metalloendopeptidase family protein [Thermoleophilaceae bacterium]|jgi:murein DD-endopeptidase MepM/ murein hydrolase activator NlpD|nr:peptidoglycan DD-metalloendopeptidase family protein [Thermoleophilaceae bacterium]
MKKTFWLPIALVLTAFLVLPLPGISAPLSSRIEKKRAQIEDKKQEETVLSTTIQRYGTRIDAVQGEISATERRLERAQASLDAQKAELLAVRNRLEEARDRLERLRSELVTARKVLAARLVEIYKADAPDALTVVLEADGFGDLLERAEFLDRISDQDREITERVRVLRDKAKEQAVRLAELEEREQLAAERILRWRDQIAAVEAQLVSSRDQLAAARADKRGALSQVRDSRVALEGDLRALEAEQAKVQAALSGAAPPGPIRQGSGSLIWPVNGPVVSPFGMRWGRLHAGVDIAVGSGTPIRAADAGRVVLMGWVGGYGNYTCIQHNASLSTCYAHQSSFSTSNGANVSQGQVIGYVGCTGHCFGDHLHFETRVSGSPVDPLGYL